MWCMQYTKHGIKFNVFAGSSIGSVNVSILASAQNAGKDPAKVLRDFWQTISEDIPYLDSSFWTQITNSSMFPRDTASSSLFSSYPEQIEKMNAFVASMYTAFFGTPRAFMPRWFIPGSYFDVDEMQYNRPQDTTSLGGSYATFFPFAWSYLYDSAPLKSTLKDFIDFDVLKKNPDAGTSERAPARLIITSTNIQTGKTIVFDNQKMDIDVEKILAGTSYPFYGIKWIKVDKSYLWDGSLLSNTPLGEILFASPSIDKEFYVVDVFPRRQKHIPQNMVEVWHRARDILFLDKTDKSLEMAEEKKRYVNLLKEMNIIISSKSSQIDDATKANLKKVHQEFEEIVNKKGATVQDVIRITRSEEMHYLLEDADFSKHRVDKLIQEGEQDCENALDNAQKDNRQKLPEQEKKQERQLTGFENKQALTS